MIAVFICTLCCVSLGKRWMALKPFRVAVRSVAVVVGRWLSRLADLSLGRAIPLVRGQTEGRKMGMLRYWMERESRVQVRRNRRTEARVQCDHMS